MCKKTKKRRDKRDKFRFELSIFEVERFGERAS